MDSDFSPPARLAPLQEVMLRDSFAEPEAGHHVEQVEIAFSRPMAAAAIREAWRETVDRTEALRSAFEFSHGIPTGIRTVQDFPTLRLPESLPADWDSWLAADRGLPLPAAGEVPWRVVLRPDSRRLVWTFHHALLDGRSITRVLGNFLACLDGSPPATFPRSVWQPPTSVSVATAGRLFREKFNGFKPPRLEGFRNAPSPTRASRCLGGNFLDFLDSRARREGSTTATLATWAWGQAMSVFTGAESILVEQVRAGVPQPGTAGFTMNTLPLLIRRPAAGRREEALREFRRELVALRGIEAVSFDDFRPCVFPDLGTPDVSTLMVEKTSLRHALGAWDFVESVTLRERPAESTVATATLQPDLRLEVEGPWKHEMLACWIAALEDLA